MFRTASAELDRWLARRGRKPLVLRGMRQVGKSWLLEDLGQRRFAATATIDFQQNLEAVALFRGGLPAEILSRLEAWTGVRIVPGRTLLVLDEVQQAPEVLGRIRYFAEKLPALHVALAGSSLDVVLRDAHVSMPVGRVEYGYIEPMSFEEVLRARGDELLAAELDRATLGKPVASPLHERLLERVRDYLVVGGMPAAVAAFCETGSLLEARRVQRQLLASYRDDLAKYARRLIVPLLGRVLDAVPRLVGGKFDYARAVSDAKAAQVREALELLALGRFVHKVHATDANGAPLEAEADDRWFKVVMADVGLFTCALRAPVEAVAPGETSWVNEGPVAEQFVAQALRSLGGFDVDARLFSWVRHERGSEAEVDYVIEHRGGIVPIEVKAGATGTLKSLHRFVSTKRLRVAVRVAARPLACETIEAGVPGARRARFKLITVPPYLIGQLPRLIDESE